MSRSTLYDLVNAKVLTGGNRTTAKNERTVYKAIIDESLNSIDDKDLPGGYLSINPDGIIDISFIKKDTPTGQFLKDDGTWGDASGGGGSQSFADVMTVSNVYDGSWFSIGGQSEIRNDGTIYLNWTNGTDQSSVYIESSKSIVGHYDPFYAGEFLTETDNVTHRLQDLGTSLYIGDFTLTPDYLQAIYTDNSTYENKMYFDPGGIFLRFSDLADKQGKLTVSTSQVQLRYTDGTAIADFLANASETHFSHTVQIRFDSPLYNFVGVTPDTYAYFDSSGNLISGSTPSAPNLSDVLTTGNSTGNQDITSSDTYTFATINDSAWQMVRNNFSGLSSGVGGTTSYATLYFTSTVSGTHQGSVYIDTTAIANSHSDLISFDAPAYSFTNLTVSKLLGLDGSGNVITYDVPPIFAPVDPSNLAWGAGAMASATTGALYNIAIGQNSLNSLTTGINNVIIGDTGGQNITTGSSNLMFGDDTYVTVGTINFSIAIGAGSHVTDSNQLVIGGSGAPILNAYIGQGVSHSDAKLWIGDLNLYNATVSRAIYVDASKNIAYSSTTDVELGYLSGVTSAIQTQINLKAPINNPVFTGTVTLAADPVSALQAATKSYVDNFLTGISWKNEVKAATITNIVLTGPQTVDGVILIAGDRCLVKNQSAAKDNGIYLVAAGSWTRTTDADTTAELESATVFIRLGTINSDTQWTCTNSNEPVIGTDAITFGQIAGAGTYTNGSGITLTSNVFSIAAGAITNAMLAGSIDLTTKVTGILPSSQGGTGINNTGTFTNASNTTITGGGIFALAGFTITATSTGTILTTAVAATTYAPINNPIFTGVVTVAADPVSALQVATKSYVDNFLTGISWKNEVKAATTANITLSGAQTIDGVALIAGDRCLVKNQSTAKDNGIYLVASGSWTRTTDADTTAELESATVLVRLGTVNADTQWTCTNSNEPIIGTDAITFGQIAGAGTYTNGTGITLTGNVFSIGAAAITNTMIAGMTSAQFATIISDETGSGNVVFSTSPTLTTPVLGVASATSFALTGTGGNGFVNYLTQSSQPSVPASGYATYANATGNFSWRKQSDTFERSLAGAITADRVFTLQDASGTLAFTNDPQFGTYARITTGDQTTTLATAVDITGASVNVAANTVYAYRMVIHAGCSGSGGMKFAWVCPVGATFFLGLMGTGSGATASNTAFANASGTLITQLFSNVISSTARIVAEGTITVGSTAGTFKAQYASVTAGQTTTLFQEGTFIYLVKIG